MSGIQEKFEEALKFDSKQEMCCFEGYIIHSDIMNEIEKLRKEKGLKESTLEERLGLEQGEYSAFRAGEKRINIAFINKIQHAFQVRFVPKFEKIDKKTSKGK